MFRIFIVFLILIASISLGLYLHDDPGYVLIAIDGWTIESTAWVAGIGLFLAFVLLYFTFSLIQSVLKLPTLWRKWQKRRRIHKAQATTMKGLIEFSEGYWAQAKNHLIKALPGSDAPLLNYLTAARAAQEMGNYTLRDEYLRQAQQSMPEAKIAVELTQAQLQLANQQWEQALATLKHLQGLAPHHPYVLKLLMKLYIQVRDWPQLIAIMPELKKHHIVSSDEYLKLQLDAYSKAMQECFTHKHFTSLEELFASLPKKLSLHPELTTIFCKYLIAEKQDEKAERLLRRAINKHYNEELIALYGNIEHDKAKLRFIESLLKTHPHAASLHLTLGKIAINNNLWGKAKTHLEKSIEYGPSAHAYMALGKLLQQLNEREKASFAFKKGLALTLHKS